MVLADALSQPHRSYFHWIVVFFSGMCMGAADIVPGISGGTVAFIIGIYPELLQSLNSFNTNTLKLLMSFKIKEAANSVGWKFLLVLLSGISLSFFTLAQFFSDILVHEVYRVYLYSAFFGLILASMWFCSRLLDRWQARHAVIFFIGVLIAYGLTNVHFSVKNDQPLYKVAVDIKKPDMAVDNYSDGMLSHVHAETLSAMLSKEIIKSDAAVVNESTGTSGMAKDFAFYPSDKVLDPWIIGCGAIAISAMLLPGISGSYLLTILGVYGVVIAALADFIRGAKAGIFESEAFYILASMMIGIVIGALAFSRVVAWLLKHYHDGTIAVLIGFMVGALGSVWPFWSYRYTFLPLKLGKGPQLYVVERVMPGLSSDIFLYSLCFAAAGFCLVFLLEWIAQKRHV